KAYKSYFLIASSSDIFSFFKRSIKSQRFLLVLYISTSCFSVISNPFSFNSLIKYLSILIIIFNTPIIIRSYIQMNLILIIEVLKKYILVVCVLKSYIHFSNTLQK